MLLVLLLVVGAYLGQRRWGGVPGALKGIGIVLLGWIALAFLLTFVMTAGGPAIEDILLSVEEGVE